MWVMAHIGLREKSIHSKGPGSNRTGSAASVSDGKDEDHWGLVDPSSPASERMKPGGSHHGSSTPARAAAAAEEDGPAELPASFARLGELRSAAESEGGRRPEDLLTDWSADPFGLSPDELCVAAFAALESVGTFDPANSFCSRPCAWGFVCAIRHRYRANNPFHNFRHAVDVTCTAAHFLALTEHRRLFEPRERFALLVAALGHDLHHPGVTNNFLVTTRSTLAVRYNDASVLENHHCASLFELLGANPAIDVLGGFDDVTFRALRKLMIGAVLNTDMAKHFHIVAQAEAYCQQHELDAGGAGVGWPGSPVSADERALLFNLMLHCADISNPFKPLAIFEQWTECIMEEFFAQGDRERELGLHPSPGFDREGSSLESSQVNFIDFIVMPLVAPMTILLPELGDLAASVASNRHEQALRKDLADSQRLSLDGQRLQEERAQNAKRTAAFAAKYGRLLDALEEAKLKRGVTGRLASPTRLGSTTSGNGFNPLFSSRTRRQSAYASSFVKDRSQPSVLLGSGRAQNGSIAAAIGGLSRAETTRGGWMGTATAAAVLRVGSPHSAGARPVAGSPAHRKVRRSGSAGMPSSPRDVMTLMVPAIKTAARSHLQRTQLESSGRGGSAGGPFARSPEEEEERLQTVRASARSSSCSIIEDRTEARLASVVLGPAPPPVAAAGEGSVRRAQMSSSSPVAQAPPPPAQEQGRLSPVLQPVAQPQAVFHPHTSPSAGVAPKALTRLTRSSLDL